MQEETSIQNDRYTEGKWFIRRGCEIGTANLSHPRRFNSHPLPSVTARFDELTIYFWKLFPSRKDTKLHVTTLSSFFSEMALNDTTWLGQPLCITLMYNKTMGLIYF